TGQDSLAIRAGKKMRGEELLMTQLGGVRLKHELDRIPLWRGNHVSVKQLAEDTAKYLYLPRLRDTDVLLAAIRDGISRLTWKTETFAYAEKYDEAKKRYVGLQHGNAGQILIDGQSVLVKPEVAAAQIDADKLAEDSRVSVNTGTTPVTGGSQTTSNGNNVIVVPTEGSPSPKAKPRRFHGTVDLDTLRVGRDAGRIAEEVVQHLSSLTGVAVKVTLEIEAEIPQGASDELVRTITENCRTLKFKSQGFEES
ncbi:MAG: AAA+ family ATPase, partial [Phycisphaerae bacterium]